MDFIKNFFTAFVLVFIAGMFIVSMIGRANMNSKIMECMEWKGDLHSEQVYNDCVLLVQGVQP
jgi:hypothetical protein